MKPQDKNENVGEKKKPYVNPNTEFFRISAFTNILNTGILVIILVIMTYILYAQSAEQEFLRTTVNFILRKL